MKGWGGEIHAYIETIRNFNLQTQTTKSPKRQEAGSLKNFSLDKKKSVYFLRVSASLLKQILPFMQWSVLMTMEEDHELGK